MIPVPKQGPARHKVDALRGLLRSEHRVRTAPVHGGGKTGGTAAAIGRGLRDTP